MRGFLERLLQQLKAFFRQLVGGKAKSQSSLSQSSPTDSVSPPRASSTWVDRPISRYPSLPRRDLLIDKPFELERDRDTENVSPAQTKPPISRYPAMPRRDLLVERPFGPGSNQSAKQFEVELDRNKPTNSSAQTVREQTRSSQPTSVAPSSPPPPSSQQPQIRPYISYQIDALEKLVDSECNNPDILSAIHHELQFRSRRRSEILRERIAYRLSQLQNAPFVWPKTTATKGNQTLSSQVFRHEEGLLRRCGYRVGANGLPEHQRRWILDDIYLRPLPSMENRAYLCEWGEPQTAQRLRKLANTIAAFTRNAKHRNTRNFETAIAHWESDLAYLKRAYYDNRFDFQWPHTA